MPRQGTWAFTPNSRGKPVPQPVRQRTEARVRGYAEEHHAGRYTHLDIYPGFERSSAASMLTQNRCRPAELAPANWPATREEYIERMRATSVHLCRLRYLGDEQWWGFGLYAYSSEKYELSVFPSGEFFGPPEDAFELSANVYLR